MTPAAFLRLLRGTLLHDRPLYAHYAITHRCNLRCAACTTWQLAEPARELPPAEVAELAQMLARLGVVQVSLSGGEPAMRDDLPEIVQAFRAAGIRPRVLTNGVALTPPVIDRLFAAGLTDVSFSLDSLRAPVQEAIDGAPGLQAKRLANLRHLAARLPRRGTLPLLNTIVNRLNLDELPSLVDFAARLGFFISFIPLHQPAGDEVGHRFYRRNQELAFRPEDEPRLRAVFAQLIAAKRRGEPVFGSSSFLAASPDHLLGRRPAWPCRAGRLYLSVAPDGRLSPCHAFEDRLAYPYRGFSAVFRSADYRQRVRGLAAECEGCLRPCWTEISLSLLEGRGFTEALQRQWRARRERPVFDTSLPPFADLP